MKLLVDMNLSPRWVGLMAEEGFDAAHWSSVGASNASDATIMRYARDHDYVVLTHDLDFSAILAATQGSKPSVVQIRSDDVSPHVIGAQVVIALRQMVPELAAGALITVDPSAVVHAIWNIKTRLWRQGGVANPRDTFGYRCGLRLALTPNPSFLFAPSSMHHCTSRTRLRVLPLV